MGKDLPESVNSADGATASMEPSRFVFVEGVSPSMRALEAVIRELALSEVPVLLLGELGAGKHAIAQRIHEMSRRSTQPFRAVSCATLQPEQWATPTAPAEALPWRGTVFLEELADLSSHCQAWLLDVLPTAEDHEGLAGSPARLICGSARDLELEVKAGRFREDLYYRSSGVCLRLPPLRQRREDISLLVAHFLRKYARDFRRPVPLLSAETLQLFQDYSW